MARIRSIKPGYFTSLDTAGTLTRDTRLHFAGLWTYADDDGRGLDEPRLIKAAVWALDDDIGAAEIEAMQDELSRAGRIIRYSVEGKRYFQVVNWHAHQKPNRPQPSSYPAPSEDTGSPPDADTESSVNDHGADTEDSSPEGSGGERSGGEGARRKRRSVSTSLPGDWEPNSGHREKAAKLRVDADAEAEAFRDHHLARDSRFVDWDRAFHTWLTNTQKFGANGGQVNGQIPLGRGPVDEHGIGKAAM